MITSAQRRALLAGGEPTQARTLESERWKSRTRIRTYTLSHLQGAPRGSTAAQRKTIMPAEKKIPCAPERPSHTKDCALKNHSNKNTDRLTDKQDKRGENKSE